MRTPGTVARTVSLLFLVAVFFFLAGPRPLHATPVGYDSSGASVAAYFPPFEDAEGVTLAMLDEARHFVHIAQYNIRNERMFQKLLALRGRGVEVKIVIDGKNSLNPWNTLDDAMEAAGLDVRRHYPGGARHAIMHHKFCVIDGVTVLTGSYNWNHTAQISNQESMLLIRSPSVAMAYEEEFQELVGRRSEGTNRFTSSERLKVYFCPEDKPARYIAGEIRGAKRSICVAMFTFTYSSLADELIAAARRGVRVEVMMERKQAGNSRVDERLAAAGVKVVVGANRTTQYSAMHHKHAVIDGKTVIVGAANWTNVGLKKSNEDVIILRDPSVAHRFLADFAALMKRFDPSYKAGTYGDFTCYLAPVNFLAVHDLTYWGDTVCVVGNIPELGKWNPARAVPLRTSDDCFPVWGGMIQVPPGMRFEYKYITKTAWGTIYWEHGENRVFIASPEGIGLTVRDDYRY
jgi:phosphatidylserine/phosphatidylglycerophosphate/cardiolipin synthase-like enzyme